MAVRINLKKKTVALSVGDLVSEPIGGGRVSGIGMGARLALGREAHAEYQFRQMWSRQKYGKEVSIRFETAVDDFAVKVQGRIDGVYESDDGGSRVVEEVKSVVASPMAFGAIGAGSYPHYVEQLRLYCFLLGVAAEEETVGAGDGSVGLKLPVAGRLVFVNVADNMRKEVPVPGPYDDCAGLITDRVRVLIDRAVADDEWKQARREGRVTLQFPHGQPRRFQDEMMAAVGKALESGRHLMVSAPSGIGKTAGALYPAVQHALATGKRVFFVTAKNTQQALALETLSRMGATGKGGLTAVQLRARESMCINQVYACREEYCTHLQNFRAKLERSRVLDWLLERGVVDVDAAMNAGRVTGVCPFELALLESERADVVVCDYNYVFDPQVYLRRFFDEDHKDAILIIDEAHNLVQRAMDYYSPVLRRRTARDAAAGLDHVEAGLAMELKKFFRGIDSFFRELDQRGGDEYSQVESVARGDAEKFMIESPRPFFEEIRPVANRLAVRYFLDKVSSGRVIEDDPVEAMFAEIGQFTTVLALDGGEFAHVYDVTGGRSLKIVCKDASRFLGGRMDGFHSVVAMSATLGPVGFYRDMLGLDAERTDVVELPSPFPRENREVVVVSDVLTTFRHRAGGFDRIAEVIEETVSAHAGNYMALFPSYDFLRGVREVLGERELIGAEVIVQEPRMTEQQRVEVLASLGRGTGGGSRLVLAVQGGIFAEGVDYAGDLLSGVVVVSPALPQVSFERDLMREHYDQKYGSGFDYAYVFPGMSRVIQSVGRLIRTETDRGVAVLVCRRFSQTQYARLFPSDWGAVKMVGGQRGELRDRLVEFWDGKS